MKTLNEDSQKLNLDVFNKPLFPISSKQANEFVSKIKSGAIKLPKELQIKLQ
jgi:hypothetical protein